MFSLKQNFPNPPSGFLLIQRESFGLSLSSSPDGYGFQISNETYEALINIQNKHPELFLQKSVFKKQN